MSDIEPWHGTLGGRTNHNCKCEDCRAAWAAYTKAARQRRSQNIPDDKHGTLSSYFNYSCRCERCRVAKAQRARELAKGAQRRPTGTASEASRQRRELIMRLRQQGWTQQRIAQEVGITQRGVVYHLQRAGER
jgi:transcriptional regulator with GAF, ATPase, and Fis domain